MVAGDVLEGRSQQAFTEPASIKRGGVDEVHPAIQGDADRAQGFAKVHLAADELERARELLRDLVTSNPDNPQYLAQYTRSLLQAGDANGAAICFQKLKSREPDSPRTRELQALVRPGR